MPYSRQLFLLLLVFGIAPVILLGIFMMLFLHLGLERTIRNQLEVSLSQVDHNLTESIYQGIGLGRELSANPYVAWFFNPDSEGDAETRLLLNQTMFDAIRSGGHISAIYAVSTLDDIYTGTEGVPMKYRYPANTNYWGAFRHSYDNRDSYIYYGSTESDSAGILIVQPVYASDSLSGYIIISIRRDDFLPDMNGGPFSSHIYIHDRFDNLIFSSDVSTQPGLDQLPDELRNPDDTISIVNDASGLYISAEMPVEQIRNMHRYVVMIMVVLSLVCIGACIIISRRTATTVSRPILEIIRFMEYVQSGDFTHHLECSRTDEIGQLQFAYNSMTDKLNSLVNDIEEKQTLLRIAEQKNLRAQINPHMLYTVLDWLGGRQSLARQTKSRRRLSISRKYSGPHSIIQQISSRLRMSWNS